VVGVETRGSDARPSPIRLGPAFATWFVGWVVGMFIVASAILLAFGVDGDDYTIPQLAVATVASWAVFLVALGYTSQRYGSGELLGDFRSHYALAFRPIDLLGVPAGVIGQIAVVPMVYVPLRAIWPDTFSTSELEERARELADKADGWTVVLLVLVVAVGAPIVEELVYRGLLQRSIAGVIGAAPGLVVASIWFALVHPSPIEYPGLFCAGLLFGAGLLLTGRIGPSIVTHAAFNATGLVLALR
jgi:membrane protease YdiL (CAAX protease family)